VQRDLERELIRKCRGGDARFYEPLVRAYEPQGMRLAIGMMGNAEDARDALQESFVKAFQSLPRFNLERPFGPWFFQILRNQCRDLLRSRKARFRMEVLEDGRFDFYSDDAASGGARRERERLDARRILWQALERLPEEQREILVLKELEGFKYDEIASILDIPAGTVASRLFHARQALREVLDQLGERYP
jgi:RNA polymerase sigma-70 factor (ECF subfamily)